MRWYYTEHEPPAKEPEQKKAGVTEMLRILRLLRGRALISMLSCGETPCKKVLQKYSIPVAARDVQQEILAGSGCT